MGNCLWLLKATVLIVTCGVLRTDSDFLESFRPKEENPSQLNAFLANVLDHKDDFAFVKQAARQYQKMKKEIHFTNLYEDLDTSLDNYNDFDNAYKLYDKRNIPHHSANRKFRNPAFSPVMPRNKFHDKLEKRVKKHVKDTEVSKVQDDVVRKRMPAPAAVQSVKQQGGEKHLPSQVFIEDEGEKIQKRTPEEIVVESEGEKGKLDVAQRDKKQAMDLSNEIHRTYKFNPRHKTSQMGSNKESQFYYVDLGETAEREKERYGDRRRFGWNPHRDSYRKMYKRPMMRERQHSRDYPQYEMDPHRSRSDEVAFEKALSYEIEPRHQDRYSSYNNPSGNNLYSVDEGRPDTLEFLYPSKTYQERLRYDYPPQNFETVTNENFLINNDNVIKEQKTTSTERIPISNATTQTHHEKNGKRTIKHTANGFIEISKSQRDDGDESFENDESTFLSKKSLPNEREIDSNQKTKYFEDDDHNKEVSSIVAKHSLHPLRIKDVSYDTDREFVNTRKDTDSDDKFYSIRSQGVNSFQTRKLQFNDYYMTDEQNDNYEDIPNRPRRDFLDALGMKNEEDYSEDNPYKNELNVNNTDVHNDTHIATSTCGTTAKKNVSFAIQKEDVKNIKRILEEPKETTTRTTCVKEAQEKRAKKSVASEEFDNDEIRTIRGTKKDIETKIMENKDKIYNAYEDTKSRAFNTNHVDVRQARPEHGPSKWPQDTREDDKLRKKSIQIDHRIEKKEDLTNTETTTTENHTETVTTENSNYEQIAQQMDVENEKLAQVVNGHLASKIVSTVFEELKKKSSLKTKFYPGLSRKHVNYAGTIDFDIFKANETEDVDEARLLLAQITKVLNKLVLNQVRRKLCQRLPDELRDYLDTILNVKNTLQTTSFVPNAQQGKFLFTYQDKNEIPFDLKKMNEILDNLEGLLSNYHSMNEACQNRAAPVKEYIEQHVKMLKQIVGCPTHQCEDKFVEAKRNTPQVSSKRFHDLLVQKQLDSLGLGSHHEFVPNFDLNQIVRNKMKFQWKKDKKRDVAKSSGPKSRQYRKLQLAADKLREKRENDKKIAESFGGKQKRFADNFEIDYEEPVVYNIG